MKTKDFAISLRVQRELLPISKKLSKLDEKECNGELEENEWEHKTFKLEAEAQKIADWVELEIYHQTDPRGASLYLIEKGEKEYTNGMPIV